MNKFNNSRGLLAIEISLFILGVIGVYLLLANFAPGGPISTDVIGYMNVGLRGLATPPILNRYFHVFLQSIFLKGASSPLTGAQNYWAFLIAGTCGLVYLAARLFSRRGNVMHGLLALALFFSIHEIVVNAGIPLVDDTAMFMMMLFIVLIILSARRGHQSIVLVALLGFVLYLAFRTKETALIAGLAVFGLGMTEEKPFDWRLFLRRMSYVGLGVLVAVVFFILLNTIFLHKPLFGFRLSDLQEFFGVYVGNILWSPNITGYDNWFTAYLFTGLLIPFTLYIVSAMKAAREVESYPGMRLVWLIPLAVIAFVSMTVSKQWGFAPRYVIAILPFVAFLAPQFLNLDLGAGQNKTQRQRALVVFVTGVLIVVIARIAIRFIVPKIGWDIGLFLEIVFIPILLAIILALSFSWKMPSLLVSIVIAILILAIVSIPIVNNVKYAVRDHPNLHYSQELFYPFSAFPDQIHYTADMRMYVSLNIWNLMGMSAYVKDRNELSAVFNIYFNARSSIDNFTLTDGSTDIAQDLLSTNYNYALLSREDWQVATQEEGMASRLEQIYQVFQEDTQRVVLLKLK
ncbi:MAG TPA: hypothetical protein VLD65_11695 [Anaerolineales bacterium]|nr:hypothetical protein [Anaerolineales bacterium]